MRTRRSLINSVFGCSTWCADEPGFLSDRFGFRLLLDVLASQPEQDVLFAVFALEEISEHSPSSCNKRDNNVRTTLAQRCHPQTRSSCRAQRHRQKSQMKVTYLDMGMMGDWRMSRAAFSSNPTEEEEEGRKKRLQMDGCTYRHWHRHIDR